MNVSFVKVEFISELAQCKVWFHRHISNVINKSVNQLKKKNTQNNKIGPIFLGMSWQPSAAFWLIVLVGFTLWDHLNFPSKKDKRRCELYIHKTLSLEKSNNQSAKMKHYSINTFTVCSTHFTTDVVLICDPSTRSLNKKAFVQSRLKPHWCTQHGSQFLSWANMF